ncbi:cyclase family protein [Pseudomonas poae]|uniref:cyclase family protein n=1 Tax=Pseudomonas poae TaxID=200451 RepID=UPI0030CBCCF4
MKGFKVSTASLFLTALFAAGASYADDMSLWKTYEQSFKEAKYIDLTHAFEPDMPVWPGFGGATFKAAAASATIPDFVNKGDEFTYEKHGFVATAYDLPTDQYGTQLDPPAHWNPWVQRSATCPQHSAYVHLW